MTLREVILKGRFCIPIAVKEEQYVIEAMQSQFNHAADILRHDEAKLINAQSVFDDLYPTTSVTKRVIVKRPAPLPPFPVCWIEARWQQQYTIGVMAHRWTFSEYQKTERYRDGLDKHIEPFNPKWVVECLVIVEQEGLARVKTYFVYWLDHNDDYQMSIRLGTFDVELPDESEEDAKESNDRFTGLVVSLTLHTFSRMHCENARLIPIDNGQRSRTTAKKKGRKQRCSAPVQAIAQPVIWHEIKVTDAPVGRSSQHSTADEHDGTSRDLPESDVRGHYADYRFGPGLFGNPKLRVVYWISHHKRGNKDFGKVNASYTIKKSSAK